MNGTLVIFMLVVLTAFTVGTAIGFGHSIIAMTLGVHLYPIEQVIPIVVLFNIATSLYLTLRHRSGIDAPLLFKKILPLTFLGMPIGLLVFHLLRTDKLKFGFGVFVFLLAVFELVRTLREDGRAAQKPLGPIQSRLWLLAGGVVQGLWVSGGPLIAYWANRNIPGKREFRSTLSALWLALNIVLLAWHAAMGRFTLESLKMSALLLPFLAGGMAIGERLHDLLPERAFKISVYLLLIFAGLSIVVRGA